MKHPDELNDWFNKYICNKKTLALLDSGSGAEKMNVLINAIKNCESLADALDQLEHSNELNKKPKR